MHKPVTGQRQHAEHQSAEDLHMSPDTQAGAELVLEAGIRPLGPGTDAVAGAPRHDQAADAPGQLLLQLLE